MNAAIERVSGRKFWSWWGEDDWGVAALECVLIAALVAMAIIGGASLLGLNAGRAAAMVAGLI